MKARFGAAVGVMGMLIASIASAHVTVKPGEAGVGSFQTFNVSVPSEKDIDTVGLTINVPPGLNHVTPTFKPGWAIVTHTDANDHIDTITWTGGRIPGHLRDDFSFSAQVPTQPTTLQWKAFQKYSDGSVVSWNLDPKAEQPKDATGKSDFSKNGPYSETKVVDDLAAAKSKTIAGIPEAQFPNVLSVIALALSISALVLASRKSSRR